MEEHDDQEERRRYRSVPNSLSCDPINRTKSQPGHVRDCAGFWTPAITDSTLQAIANALNARGARTARGGRWHSSTVYNLLLRARRL
jgi:hypothetical protein